MRGQSTLTILAHSTTVDYIIANASTAEGILENVSDYLAISVMLHFDTSTEERYDPHSVDRIDWKQALADDMIGQYQCGVQLRSPLKHCGRH